ncbi:MAG: LytTR family transcriptional regulator [Bacteroidetes bacterium]|nr:LytTR family transcriptional regulator [Bacteroidota bacterium]
MESNSHFLILTWFAEIIADRSMEIVFTITSIIFNIFLILWSILIISKYYKVRKKIAVILIDNNLLIEKNKEISDKLESLQMPESSKQELEKEKVSENETEEENPEYLKESHAASISHVWVEGNYINLKYKDRMKYVLVRDRLKNIYNHWYKYHFIQTHKSYLVNMKMINQVNWNMIILTDGSKVPLSRTNKKEFQDAYALFLSKNEVADVM